MTSQWPLHSFLELGALPGAAPCARLHARHLLWEWGLAALTDSTELVVGADHQRDTSIPRHRAEHAGATVAAIGQGADSHSGLGRQPALTVRADISDETENGRAWSW